jgi:hypothetical protein
MIPIRHPIFAGILEMHRADNNDSEHEDNTKEPDGEFEEREELSRRSSVSHKHMYSKPVAHLRRTHRAPQN